MPHTRVIPVDPSAPDRAAIAEAAAVLRRGGLVAFATETVYGLGADATNPAAVARIFAAKGRPALNPLIVHASSTAMARSCVAAWDARADALARAFWPGPLTLVLPRSALVPDAVTAGRATVGVRVPRPLVSRALIDAAARPLAAPSANRSTGVSPTLAHHVLDDLDGRVDLVLDSGPTDVGLESTVVDLSSDRPAILRPGPIGAGALEPFVGTLGFGAAPGKLPSEAWLSPGQMAVHYAPRTRTVRVDDPEPLARLDRSQRAAVLVFGASELPPLPPGTSTFRLADPESAARSLYAVLRECDALGGALIVIVSPPDRPEWHAIRDRLRRASRPWDNAP
jgi:L-threonylcarbamoyladenylate synthase